ncbi:MAG: hypothetical protein PHF74_08140 [Dehalococcoidales bacterium]|nr:hypothetical protein [Dehalococcoidales bacterium]
MRKRVAVVAGILAVASMCVWLYTENVSWDTDPTAVGGQRRGILIQTPTDETLSVSLDEVTSGDTSLAVRGSITATMDFADITNGDTSVNVRSTDLDMRDLSQATDTIQVFQPDPSQAKFLMYGNTAKDGTGIFYVPKLDTDGHLQIDALTLPSVTIGTFPDNEPFNFAQYGGSAVGADNGVYVRPGTDTPFYPADYSDSTHQESGNAILEDIKTNTDPLVTAGGGGYVRQDSTATIAKETGGNLATVKTNTDPLVTAGGGGYIRQDSTATIAKEAGGNLADVKTAAEAINTKMPASPSDSTRQDTGNALAEDIKTAVEAINTAIQSGGVTQAQLAAIVTDIAAIELRLDDMTLPDSVIVERFEVQGYTEVSKSYTNVSHIEVYVQTADKTVRMGIGGNDTSTNYLSIAEADALGWTKSNMRFASFPMVFKGDTETDTATVVTQRWTY